MVTREHARQVMFSLQPRFPSKRQAQERQASLQQLEAMKPDQKIVAGLEALQRLSPGPRKCRVCDKPGGDLVLGQFHLACLELVDRPVVRCIACSALPKYADCIPDEASVVTDRRCFLPLAEVQAPYREITPENTPLPMGCLPEACPDCGGKVIVSASASKKFDLYKLPGGGTLLWGTPKKAHMGRKLR